MATYSLTSPDGNTYPTDSVLLRQRLLGQGYTEKTPPAAVQGGVFDPSEHTVADVTAHLSDADDAERERVLAIERDGKARSGVLGYDPPDDAA